ncbi:hypothetical protein [Flavobacterium columnare]|uniref:hypothetical protein n=1 Tax=Flavobacterium TaxID=237 RepID=UPI00296F5C77
MKGYSQKFHFDEELLPENYSIKHFGINSEFWNKLNRLQMTYKNCTIYIDYYLIQVAS